MMMSVFRKQSVWVALAVLAMGALLMSGCSPTTAAYAAAAAESTLAQTGTATPATASKTNTASSPANTAQGATVDTSRTITVVGHGEVKAKPDVARTSLGIEVTAGTVADAVKQANAQMDAVLKAVKAVGIPDKDIQTSNFSINFERTPSGPSAPISKGITGTETAEPAPAGVYHVNNMVNVTIRDLTKVGAVIDAAVNAGANNVWGINFGLENTATQELAAREQAIADAKSRAQSLAGLTGVNLGSVVAVSEVINGGPVPMAKFAAAQGLGGGGTPVESGEVSFTTDIQVIYAIQ
jgi:uncharacterized protein